MPEIENIDGIGDMIKRYRSWKWTYGESPEYNMKLENRFSWGLVEICFFIDSGRIMECRIFTDSLSTSGFSELSDSITGKDFNLSAISDSIENSSLSYEVRKDLISLISKSVN